MSLINDLRGNPKLQKERDLERQAFDLLQMIVTHSASPKPGEFIKRYGKKFDLSQFKARHFNKNYK